MQAQTGSCNSSLSWPRCFPDGLTRRTIPKSGTTRDAPRTSGGQTARRPEKFIADVLIVRHLSVSHCQYRTLDASAPRSISLLVPVSLLPLFIAGSGAEIWLCSDEHKCSISLPARLVLAVQYRAACCSLEF